MSQRVSTAARVSLLAVCLATAASYAGAQTAVTSLDQFKAAMAAIGDAFEVIEPMTPSPAYLLNSARGDSLARLAIADGQMRQVREFFLGRKKPDGVWFADEALEAMAALHGELSRAEPNQADAIDALASVTRRCAACHDAYREGDKDTGYRFKPGVL